MVLYGVTVPLAPYRVGRDLSDFVKSGQPKQASGQLRSKSPLGRHGAKSCQVGQHFAQRQGRLGRLWPDAAWFT